MNTVKLLVQGMVCDSCAGHVDRALRSTAGVTSAEVDLKEKTAVITYDSGKVTDGQLIKVIEEEGYEASLPFASQRR